MPRVTLRSKCIYKESVTYPASCPLSRLPHNIEQHEDTTLPTTTSAMTLSRPLQLGDAMKMDSRIPYGSGEQFTIICSPTTNLLDMIDHTLLLPELDSTCEQRDFLTQVVWELKYHQKKIPAYLKPLSTQFPADAFFVAQSLIKKLLNKSEVFLSLPKEIADTYIQDVTESLMVMGCRKVMHRPAAYVYIPSRSSAISKASRFPQYLRKF